MSEIISAFVGTEVLEAFAEERPQGVNRAASRRANNRLQFGKAEFDWVEVRTVGREIEEGRAGALDQASHAGDFVRAEVVGDDEIAGHERRHEDLFDVGEEARTVERAVEHAGRGQAADAERREKGAGPPSGKWGVVVDADATGCAAVASQQVRRDTRFIEEDEMSRVPRRRELSPLGARGGNVRSIVLAGSYGFF